MKNNLQPSAEEEKLFHETQANKALEKTKKEDLIFSDSAFFCSPGSIWAFEQLGDLRGKTVLDYGCGTGLSAVTLARAGAKVVAMDISHGLTRLTQMTVDANNVIDRVIYTCAAGEWLPFKNETFDVIHGNAILHHVNLDTGGPELARVLKPGGIALFGEPLGHNPILEFCRKHVHYPGKDRSPTERSLLYEDIEKFKKSFSHVDIYEVEFLEMLRRVIKNKKIKNSLFKFDQRLLAWFPWLKPLCRAVYLKAIR